MAVEAVSPRARAEWAVKLGIKAGSPAAVAFGKALRRMRTAGDPLTQEEAARMCGVSGSIWNTWESGRGLPGEASWRLIRDYVGPEQALALIGAAQRAARKTSKVPAPEMTFVPRADEEDEYPFPDAGRTPRGGDRVSRNVPRGSDTEPVLAAVLACGLPDKSKALLCAAVVAMAAGVDIEVEIRARV